MRLVRMGGNVHTSELVEMSLSLSRPKAFLARMPATTFMVAGCVKVGSLRR